MENLADVKGEDALHISSTTLSATGTGYGAGRHRAAHGTERHRADQSGPEQTRADQSGPERTRAARAAQSGPERRRADQSGTERHRADQPA